MKAQVKNIMIRRAEGVDGFDHYKAFNFPNFELAQKHLAAISVNSPKPDEGGYDKTDFEITWEGDLDDSYSGRIDLKYGGLGDGETLREHVKSFLLFSAGEKKPDHMTQAQYDRYVTEAMRAEAREYLDTHEI